MKKEDSKSSHTLENVLYLSTIGQQRDRSTSKSEINSKDTHFLILNKMTNLSTFVVVKIMLCQSPNANQFKFYMF